MASIATESGIHIVDICLNNGDTGDTFKPRFRYFDFPAMDNEVQLFNYDNGKVIVFDGLYIYYLFVDDGVWNRVDISRLLQDGANTIIGIYPNVKCCVHTDNKRVYHIKLSNSNADELTWINISGDKEVVSVSRCGRVMLLSNGHVMIRNVSYDVGSELQYYLSLSFPEKDERSEVYYKIVYSGLTSNLVIAYNEDKLIINNKVVMCLIEGFGENTLTEWVKFLRINNNKATQLSIRDSYIGNLVKVEYDDITYTIFFLTSTSTLYKCLYHSSCTLDSNIEVVADYVEDIQLVRALSYNYMVVIYQNGNIVLQHLSEPCVSGLPMFITNIQTSRFTIPNKPKPIKKIKSALM